MSSRSGTLVAANVTKSHGAQLVLNDVTEDAGSTETGYIPVGKITIGGFAIPLAETPGLAGGVTNPRR